MLDPCCNFSLESALWLNPKITTPALAVVSHAGNMLSTRFKAVKNGRLLMFPKPVWAIAVSHLSSY